MVPEISPSPDAAPFWDACRRHELALPWCARCQRPFFYPRPLCPACGSRDLRWQRASGLGEVYSFCVQYQSRLPGYRDAVPFVTAIVELAEGPRLMTLLVDVPPRPDLIRCGMPVEVAFKDLPDGNALPVFRPVA
ncbi:MAG TPA: OB-fold domain-containing protein [Streptosporangiaceae bacterium]|nr:OB-fold domain-containing protein [Streptosporangiaceae bacterium]